VREPKPDDAPAAQTEEAAEVQTAPRQSAEGKSRESRRPRRPKPEKKPLEALGTVTAMPESPDNAHAGESRAPRPHRRRSSDRRRRPNGAHAGTPETGAEK
jgi:hypothetical protein